MNRVRMPGRIRSIRRCRSLPFIPGMMTSVSSRRISPSCRSARWKAASGVAAVRTRYPRSSRILAARERICSSSSTSRTVSEPDGGDPAAVSNPLSASSRTRGKQILNVVPTPGSL